MHEFFCEVTSYCNQKDFIMNNVMQPLIDVRGREQRKRSRKAYSFCVEISDYASSSVSGSKGGNCDADDDVFGARLAKGAVVTEAPRM